MQSILRKSILITSCLCLMTLQLRIPDSSISSLSGYSIELSFNQAQADDLSFTSSVEEAGFPKGYVSLLVMLAIGIMSLYILQSSHKFSPDSILFVIGGMIYFASVIISWTDDKVFKKLRDFIPENLQLDALLKQKELLKIALKALQKRIVFLGASTASMASASALAAIMYIKEKVTAKKALAASTKAMLDVTKVCTTNPQIVSATAQGAVFQKTGEPVPAACARLTVIANKNYAKCLKAFTSETANNDVTRSEKGSMGLDRFHVKNVNTCAVALAELGSVPAATPPVKRLVESYLPLLNHPKYFKKKIVTKFGVWSFFDLLVSRVQAKGASISDVKDALRGFNKLSDKAYSESRKLAKGMAKDSANCSGNPDSMMCDYFTGADEQFAMDLTSFGIDKAVEPAASRAVAKKVTSTPAWKAAKKSATKMLLKKAATFAALTAIGGGLVIAAPVIVGAGVVMTAFEVYNLYTELSKTTMGKETIKNVKDKIKGWFSFVQPNYIQRERPETLLSELLDFVNPIPRVEAVGFLSPVLNMTKRIAQMGKKELDTRIFSPLGRTIAFGAIGAYVGSSTVDTHNQIKRVKRDLRKLNELIQKFHEKTNKGKRFDTEFRPKKNPQSLDTFLDLIIPKAMSEQISNPKAENSFKKLMPCVVKKKGSCLHLKNLVKKRTPGNIKLSSKFKKVIGLITSAGDGIQYKRSISPKVMRTIERLSREAGNMLRLQQVAQEAINRERHKDGKSKFNFENKSRIFIQNLENKTLLIVTSSNIPHKEISNVLHFSSYGEGDEVGDEEYIEDKMSDSNDESDKEDLGELSSFDSESREDKTSKHSQDEDEDEAEDLPEEDLKDIIIETDKDIFKAISIRFLKSGFRRLEYNLSQ